MQIKLLDNLLTMSLKRYLFLLIAVFVLLLSVTQLFFINYIQQQIGNEVEDKSRALSKQALKLLVDTIPDPDQPLTRQSVPHPNTELTTPGQPAIVIRINNTPNKVVSLGEGYEFVTGDQTQTIQIESLPKVPLIEFRERLQGHLKAFNFKRLNNSYAFAVVNNDSHQIAQHIVQFGKQDSAIYQYFNWLISGTIILTLVGLLLAYWLARHISQPLRELSGGFSNLKKGELGSQITPKGIKEVRDTMLSFNQMSQRLVELNKIEKRFDQQQQMVELGEVARGLAHTLRNPINTIGLAIEQMSQTDMPQAQRIELAQQVRHKISHLDNSIKALLSLTTSDIKRDQQVNINLVINDILLEMSMTGKHKIEFSAAQNITLLGAEVEIRAMLHTLVVNAVEASNEEQIISIFISQQHKNIEIRVVDQGQGLDANIKNELFKPHISNKPEGAGMGLYIAKRISQLHYQGDIVLSDNSPQGCIATLTLAATPNEIQHHE